MLFKNIRKAAILLVCVLTLSACMTNKEYSDAMRAKYSNRLKEGLLYTNPYHSLNSVHIIHSENVTWGGR